MTTHSLAIVMRKMRNHLRRRAQQRSLPMNMLDLFVSRKEGRNANNTLYYVDHTKLQNNGNGLLPEDRNDLFSNLEKSKQELAVLGQKHKQICSDTAQLLSEPKNEELETELQGLANKMETVDNGLEEARAHVDSKFVPCLVLILISSRRIYLLTFSEHDSFPLSHRRKACEAIERPR